MPGDRGPGVGASSRGLLRSEVGGLVGGEARGGPRPDHQGFGALYQEFAVLFCRCGRVRPRAR